MPSLLTNPPAKKPTTAKVLYSAVFCDVEHLSVTLYLLFSLTPKEQSGLNRITDHLISESMVGLASTSEAAQGIEHARAEETDEGDQQKLDSRRSVPRHEPGAKLAPSIHPSLRQDDGPDCFFGG